MSSSPAVGQEHGASISQALVSQKQASEQQVLQLQGMAEDATQKIQASEDDSATLRHTLDSLGSGTVRAYVVS